MIWFFCDRCPTCVPNSDPVTRHDQKSVTIERLPEGWTTEYKRADTGDVLILCPEHSERLP